MSPAKGEITNFALKKIRRHFKRSTAACDVKYDVLPVATRR